MLDFVEGKVTIPYLLLHERLENKTKLEALYKKELSAEESLWIKEQMNITKALEDSITQAKEIGNIAINAVKDEKDSETLVFIMKAMIEREFQMSYLVISFSHKNIDIKMREKLAFSSTEDKDRFIRVLFESI